MSIPDFHATAAGSRRGRWLVPALIVAAAFAAYVNTLALGFAWDDHSLVLENPRIADPAYVRYLLFETPLWRPVKRISLMVDYAIWGPGRPAGFHLTNLALHALACLLLYAVARRLALGRAGAMVGALLFAVHPIHVEAVASISHRKEMLALLFSLAGLLAWIRMSETEPPRMPLSGLLSRLGLIAPAGRVQLARAELLACAGLCYALGILSKEVGAVMLPAVIAAHVLLFRPSGGRGRDRRYLIGGVALAAAALAVFAAQGPLGNLLASFSPDRVDSITLGRTRSYGILLLTSFKAFAVYIRLLLWPWPLYLDRSLELAQGVTDPGALAGIALVAGLAVAALRRARSAPALSFGLLWYLLNLLPVLNVVPLTFWLVAERFVYVPSAGLAIAAGVIFERVLERRAVDGKERSWTRVAALAAFVLLCLAVVTFRQNRIWKDDLTLWQHTLAHNPNSHLAWKAIGVLHAREGRMEQAEKAVRRSLELQPRFTEPHLALAEILNDGGRHDEAATEALAYLTVKPDDPTALMALGNARLHQRRLADAVAAYTKARLVGPQIPGLRMALATAQQMAGANEEALQVLAGEPDRGVEDAWFILRGRLLQRLGRTEEALADYLRAEAAAPDAAEPRARAGLLLLRMNRHPEALEALEQSLERDANQPEVLAVVKQLRK